LTDTCQGKEAHHTVDLCEDPHCLRKKVTRHDLPVAHLPTHDLLKTRRILQEREFGNVYRRAMGALRVSQRVMQAGLELADVPDRWIKIGSGAVQKQGKGEVEIGSGNDVGYTPGSGRYSPRCIACNCVMSWPCWYCIECPGMSAITRIFL
jgi:hypothetical protein